MGLFIYIVDGRILCVQTLLLALQKRENLFRYAQT